MGLVPITNDLDLVMHSVENRKRVKVTRPDLLAGALKKYANKRQEHFLCITLNSLMEVLKVHVVFIGTVQTTIVHAREVFFHAIRDNASVIAVAHNHPSGNVHPSNIDDTFTHLLCRAGRILGIPVIDHLIISGGDFYSYAKEGRLEDEAEK
jgi:DNA repair protein RadC